MKGRVLLSTSVAQRGKSGVAAYIFGLLEGFKRLGWPVQFVLAGPAEDQPLFDPWRDGCEWVGVEERWRGAAANILWHHTGLPGVIRRHACPVLHIPSYRRIVWHPPCAQVATIHDCAPFRLAGKYDLARMLYGRRVVVPLARRLDGLMTVSETTAEDIVRFFGLPRESIVVTPNGIDHDRFSPRTAAGRLALLRKPEGLRDGWWIYVARLEHPAKNHLRLIEAFTALCRNLGDDAGQLVLAGADWHGAEEIHRAVRESPVRDRIFTTGFVAGDDLPGWYGGARAMIFPSLFEGFGLPPLEAMACGCPVICSQAGSLGEVTGGAARTIDPLDPADMTRAMLEIATDPQVGASLRRRGLERAAGFTWQATAALTLEVYERAAGKRGL